MFAIGVMLYVMLYGRYPFQRGNFGVAPHMRSSEKQAFSATYSFPHTPTVSEDAQNFIRSLLASEPTERLTAEQALRDMCWVKHPDYEDVFSFSDPGSDDELETHPASEEVDHGGLDVPLPLTPQPSSPIVDWTRRQTNRVQRVFTRLLFDD